MSFLRLETSEINCTTLSRQNTGLCLIFTFIAKLYNELNFLPTKTIRLTTLLSANIRIHLQMTNGGDLFCKRTTFRQGNIHQNLHPLNDCINGPPHNLSEMLDNNVELAIAHDVKFNVFKFYLFFV